MKIDKKLLKERVRFQINILEDGTVVIVDVPREIEPVLKDLYPDNDQTRCAGETIKQISNDDNND